MAMMDRVQRILLRPKQEWQVIDAEQTAAGELFRRYVVPLAAIGPAAMLISTLVFAGSVSLVSAIIQALISWALSIVFVYVIAFVADQLAPTFGGTRSMPQALKLGAYGSTAAFVTGIFSLHPALSIGGILGLYTVYLLYTGLPVLMKVPAEKALPYTVVVIVALVVITAILSLVYLSVFPSVGV